MTTPTPRNGAAILAVLALLSIFAPLATDMYLSAFSAIEAHLAAAPGTMELSLSVFFLGLCLGQLVFGPAIDRWGRKGPLLAGVALFCTATVGLLLTDSPAAFVGLRFVQALGACGGMVVGRAVVTDLYRGQAAARAMTLLVMLTTLGPILSPLLGGLLVTGFGWPSVFVAMLAVGALALVLAGAFLPETLPREARRAAAPGAILGNYLRLLGHRGFVVPAVVGGLSFSALFAFITGSSSVLQGGFGLSPVTYGLAFGLVAMSLVVASLVNARLLRRFGAEKIIGATLPAFALAALVLVAVSGTGHLAVLLAPLWLAIGIAGGLASNATAIAMQAAKASAGTASALIGAMQFGIAALSSSVLAMLVSGSALPMTLGVLVPALAAALIWAARDTTLGATAGVEAA